MELKMYENLRTFNGYFTKGYKTYCVNHFHTEIEFLILGYSIYIYLVLPSD